jgi:predicted DNA-binding ribbon-helix-helix protein
MGENAMKSLVAKRSTVIAGRKPSVSLEDAFWKVLKDIASERDITVSNLVSRIDFEWCEARRFGGLEFEERRPDP